MKKKRLFKHLFRLNPKVKMEQMLKTNLHLSLNLNLKRKMKPDFSAEQGMALMLAVFSLFFVSSLVIVGYDLLSNETKAGRQRSSSARAADLAEAGCELVMGLLTNHADRNSFPLPEVTLKEPNFSGGSFETTAAHTENWKYRVVSKGTFDGITQVIEATVRVETSDWDSEMIITSWGPLELHGSINGPVWSADQITIKDNIFDVIFTTFSGSSVDEVFITRGHTVTPAGKVENGIHEARYRPPVLVGAGYFQHIKETADRVLTGSTVTNLDLSATPVVYYDGSQLTLSGNLTGNGRIVCRGDIVLGKVGFWSWDPLIFQNDGGQKIDLVAGGDIKISYVGTENEDAELAGRWLANNQINFFALEILGVPLKHNFIKNFAGSLRTNNGGKIVMWDFTFRPPPPTETEFDQHVITVLDWRETTLHGQTEEE